MTLPISPFDLPIEAFRAYFKAQGPFAQYGLETLEGRYVWPSPDSAFRYLPHDPSLSNFENTCRLKAELARRWKEGPEPHDELAMFIVKDWGQIGSNSPETMLVHRINAERREPELKLGGIASLSKILMISDPERFAIYDARVAVALMALQILHDAEDGIVFPYCKGRKNITGHDGKKCGFKYHPDNQSNALRQKHPRWIALRNDDGYRTYLDILHRLSAELDAPIQHLEMSLFGDAEGLAIQTGRIEPDRGLSRAGKKARALQRQH